MSAAGEQPKPIHWVGSSLKDLREFPQEVRRVFGQALFDAQRGGKHPDAKPLKGFGGAGVIEVVEDYSGDTFRAVYTIRFAGFVYVLHCFQKKSKTGSKTPLEAIHLIRKRLKDAERHYAAWQDKNRRE